jgi:hypothetical protein
MEVFWSWKFVAHQNGVKPDHMPEYGAFRKKSL